MTTALRDQVTRVNPFEAPQKPNYLPETNSDQLAPADLEALFDET
jgi:hypothetical protein